MLSVTKLEMCINLMVVVILMIAGSCYLLIACEGSPRSYLKMHVLLYL